MADDNLECCGSTQPSIQEGTSWRTQVDAGPSMISRCESLLPSEAHCDFRPRFPSWMEGGVEPPHSRMMV